MKNVIKILGILIIYIFCGVTAYAVNEENTVTENTVSAENVVDEKKEPEEPTEIKKNEKMYVQERCNIRASYSVESDRVGGLDVGTEVTVIAEYSNGWYKIKYDSGEAYIKAGILRSTKPETSEEKENIQEETKSEQEVVQEQTQNVVTEENTVQAESPDVIENVISTEEVSIEDAELINEIGVLPEVGKNIADYLFWSVIILAIIAVGIIKYKEI